MFFPFFSGVGILPYFGEQVGLWTLSFMGLGKLVLDGYLFSECNCMSSVETAMGPFPRFQLHTGSLVLVPCLPHLVREASASNTVSV